MKPRQRPSPGSRCPTCGGVFPLRVKRRKGGRTYVKLSRWMGRQREGSHAVRVYWPRDRYWYGAASRCPDPYHQPSEPGLHPRPRSRR